MYQNIVLAYDGSQAGQQALLNSKELTQWKKGELHLLAVVPYDLVALGPESVYYSEEQQQVEEQKYREILQAGLAQLTDNGIQFADLPRNRDGWTARFRVHRFDQICNQHGIEHRLTKVNHPWTNGQVERMNRTIKEATIKRF